MLQINFYIYRIVQTSTRFLFNNALFNALPHFKFFLCPIGYRYSYNHKINRHNFPFYFSSPYAPSFTHEVQYQHIFSNLIFLQPLLQILEDTFQNVSIFQLHWRLIIPIQSQNKSLYFFLFCLPHILWIHVSLQRVFARLILSQRPFQILQFLRRHSFKKEKKKKETLYHNQREGEN